MGLPLRIIFAAQMVPAPAFLATLKKKSRVLLAVVFAAGALPAAGQAPTTLRGDSVMMRAATPPAPAPTDSVVQRRRRRRLLAGGSALSYGGQHIVYNDGINRPPRTADSTDGTDYLRFRTLGRRWSRIVLPKSLGEEAAAGSLRHINQPWGRLGKAAARAAVTNRTFTTSGRISPFETTKRRNPK